MYICNVKQQQLKLRAMTTTSNIIWTINDSNSGTWAKVTTPEGTFNLKLTYKTVMNGRREWSVNGQWPKDKYMITYNGGELFVLPLGGDFEVGQVINHKAFGQGTISSIVGEVVTIQFANGSKSLMKSILKNFIK